jgi:PAT family beta-lactamase induction signal transducer AmpG
MPVAKNRPLWDSIQPYCEKEALAAFFIGVSSGFPFAMIAATLTTRLSQEGITRRTVTAFSLVYLVYNLKFLWAWIVEGVRLPLLCRLGQRVSWLLFAGALVMAAVVNLALARPAVDIHSTVIAAVLVAIAGATFDIVIDAYRIEKLRPHQLGVGSGMSQYGWRVGSAAAGGLALVVAARMGWSAGYIVCALFALPAMLTGLILGEPSRHVVLTARLGFGEIWNSIAGPFMEFFRRHGAWLVLLFILVHKIGDTLANLTFRLLFDELKFNNDEIAVYDVGFGFWAFLIGIFLGGIAYTRWGLKRSVLVALVLMAVSNLGFAVLAATGHNNWVMAGTIGFENSASGFGSVALVAYFSALCNLQFTAAQYALISAGTGVIGRLVTGTSAGRLIDSLGFVNFYVLTTIVALPGILLFWYMVRVGLIDRALGTSGNR